MNDRRILDRFDAHYESGSQFVSSSPQESRELVKIYKEIPLTLPITDEPMRRVCEVMTRAGYETTDSCEGHGRKPPSVFFCCPSQYHIRHLSNILSRESKETNYPWHITTFSGDVFLNPDWDLSFKMEPKGFHGNSVGNAYDGLIDDLHILGLCMLRYFGSVDLNSVEVHRQMVNKSALSFVVPDMENAFTKISGK